MKKIFIYSVCGLIVIIYLCLFSLAFKDDFTYSYTMYYVKGKTKFWYGNDGLIVKFGEKYNYVSKSGIGINGIQYFGKDFGFILERKEERSAIISEIQIKESSSLYYEIPNIEDVDGYKVVLETDDNKNNFNFVLNDVELKDVIHEDNKIIVLINNVEKENQLIIKSDETVRLYSLCFDEV